MKQKNVDKKLARRIAHYEQTVSGAKSDVVKNLGSDAFHRPGSRNRHKR
jgi:hypothetical protein